MNVSEICQAEVVTINDNSSVAAAAECMRDHNSGCLVVIDDQQKPIGILTDRDIAIKFVADGNDNGELTIANIMSKQPLVFSEQEDVCEVIEKLSDSGVRRAPVVDANNKLCGIIALDDIIMTIADELTSISNLIKSQNKEHISFDRFAKKPAQDFSRQAERSELGNQSQSGGKRDWGQVGDRSATTTRKQSHAPKEIHDNTDQATASAGGLGYGDQAITESRSQSSHSQKSKSTKIKETV